MSAKKSVWRVRVLPCRALALDRHYVEGDELSLSDSEAVALAKAGVVELLVEPGVVKNRVRSHQPADGP
jgi:hypothetical protein